MFGSSVTPRYGVNTTATTQDAISAMPTIQNMLLVYSPAVDLAKPFGKKPIAVTSVPASMDVAPAQIVSVATAMIPFLEHNDANRALMAR